MAVQSNAAPAEPVACEVCLKEVPKSEAAVAEAADYFLYFCGLDCFQKWQTGQGQSAPPGGPAADPNAGA